MGRAVTAASGGPVVSLIDVTVRRSGRFELTVPRLDLHPGITAVVGPNGGGKSTLLRTVATVLAPDRGRLVIGGVDATVDPGTTTVRRWLGLVPQEESVPHRMRVFDHVDLVAVARDIGSGDDDPRRARRGSVARALADLGLASLAHERAGRLSGGQRRLVAIAAALCGDARLLVLDEPDTSLDAANRDRLAALLDGRRERTTILVASHDRTWIDRLAQRTVVVADGHASPG
jgi:ABC-2 type transport system ATP-binding protein